MLDARLFKEMVEAQEMQIVRRVCPTCSASHRDIYYRRLTGMPDDFDLLDTLMNNWFDTDNKLDVDILARRTQGYEVGKIKWLLDQSMVRAFTQDKASITLEDVESLMDDEENGVANKKFVSDEKSLRSTAYHEAGHALVSYYGDEKHFKADEPLSGAAFLVPPPRHSGTVVI